MAHTFFQRLQVACTLVWGAEIAAIVAATLQEAWAFIAISGVVLLPIEFMQIMSAISREMNSIHPIIDFVREALLILGTTSLFLRLMLHAVQHPVQPPAGNHVYFRSRDDYRDVSLSVLLSHPFLYASAVLIIGFPLWTVFRLVLEIPIFPALLLIAMPIAILAWVSQLSQRTPQPHRRTRPK